MLFFLLLNIKKFIKKHYDAAQILHLFIPQRYVQKLLNSRSYADYMGFMWIAVSIVALLECLFGTVVDRSSGNCST